MSTTSSDICAAADLLLGFVGFNKKSGRHIVRFSEDSFGMDVDEDSITPASEFVWNRVDDQSMTLSRDLIQLLLDQHVNDRLGITDPLLVYMLRSDLPEIAAQRYLK
ncbi:DUF2025 family protein [Stutzerimonas kirkiae]|uniref:DUF2025 domain-containing protein n=1 Tax=Stutzerimonas kirkiae TaxID=2211392 RepID=A0A4Q9RF66_9GAMM|nr:DUF2025 family protein [Stutzerimonas kirkiae]TBU99827.1 DUF2025 domain-containing protein [Stutzerimonas kirkiae]TBV05241.1 DUF2025 domain-containing protein [Stutzerimonas kirkiae]TBV08142.1 DUF2025 domain-containing protein [Stutzerimonas kirkiae]